jgi:class 3 adenylate cyclase
VNLASRLEAYGDLGRILVSQATADISPDATGWDEHLVD